MPYKDGNPTLTEQLEEDERRRFYTDDLIKEAREEYQLGWYEAIEAAAEEAKSWGRLKLAAAIRKLKKP